MNTLEPRDWTYVLIDNPETVEVASAIIGELIQ
jgi:hypothetical protein